MTIFYIRTKALCEEHKISFRKLEMLIDAKENTSGNWKKTIPIGETILKVANHFDVSADFLLGNCNNPYSHKNDIFAESIQVLQVCEETQISFKAAEIVSDLVRSLKSKGV